MKVVAKPVDMVFWFTKEGTLKPLRFKIDTENRESKIIKIDKIKQKEIERLAGNQMLIFRCEGYLDGSLRQFELKYELSTCKWILFRI